MYEFAETREWQGCGCTGHRMRVEDGEVIGEEGRIRALGCVWEIGKRSKVDVWCWTVQREENG
jgi:hypothetical protein